MSYNQPRPDRNDNPQYRRRSTTGYHQQQQQQNRSSSAAYGKGAGAGTAPAPSTSVDSSNNRSFKKVNNVQGGGQPRVNLPPVNHSVSNNNHNGPNVQSRSQGATGEPPVIGGTANPTESLTRSSGAIPKAPTSQSPAMSSKNNESVNTAKASVDPSKGFPFQFGSIGPEVMKIPARTSSAPPNMDEQKRAQMQQASLRTASNMPASVPKKDIPNKAADNQSMRKEGHNLSSEKTDVQVPHISPPSQPQKPQITNVRMPSVQTPYQHAQVPHAAVHFGGPNMHLQPSNVSATSFQMPMPMALSMGNTPQIQQQVFFQGLPSHPMHHQVHPQLQGHGHGFAGPMGAQIHPQLGHVGVGMGPQYPQQQQQQGGKFGGARKTTPVKITHPETHEELRLDRRGDPHPDGEPVASKPHSNTPPRSQPVSSFGPRPVNMVQTPYNSNPMIYPPVSVPLNSGPPSGQAPRYHFPVIDGSQRVQFINQSATAPQLIRPAAPAHVSSDSSSSAKARDAQNVMSSALPANTKVTVKPAAAPEKLGSPKARSQGEVSISQSQKNVEAGSLSSSQLPKSGFVSGAPNLSVPPVKSSVEAVPVATTEIRRGEMVNESKSVEEVKQTCNMEPPHNQTKDHGHTMPEPPLSETESNAAKETSSLPATNGFRKQQMEVSPTSDAPTSDSQDKNIDKTTKGSSPASLEISGSSTQVTDVKCDEPTVSDKHVERSVSSDEKHETISDKAQNEVDSASDVCPDSEKSAEVKDDTSSELPHSTHIQSSNVPLGHSETQSRHGVENSGDSLTSAPATLSKDKSAFESNTRRNTTKGKKKIKEILQKADAAGTTSDLYNAYKGPEEKKDSESSNVIPDVSNQKLAPAIPQAVAEATVDAEPLKNEPEDWEDAADVSTPKLETADNCLHAKRGSSDEVRDSSSNTEKKYSRDFLLKFADLFTALPEGFDVAPDIGNALIFANMGASHHEHDSHPSHGKVMDRQASGARLDRRPNNLVVDDRWTKNQSPLPAGYGGNVGFRPGQGGNLGVLRHPRMQGPIRGMPQGVPVGGMGRNNPDLERWQRGANFQQKGLFPSPHAPMAVMHKAERKYQVGTVADEEQAKQRQLKGILNKLTPQNFEKLFEQVKSVNIDNAVTLTGVISQIFDKALMEPTFCEMYADFCFHLSGALPDFNENGEKITFKRLLLNKCQEEFERGEKEEEEANSRVAEEGQVEQTEEEREEKRLKVRRRMLGNIRLIGELYKKRMLTEKIMHACIQKLLGYDQDPHEENIEALCKLMSTIGVMIDHQKAKILMDGYFEKMKMLSNKQELSSRVRFMLINAIDLRKNKWQERMKVEGPKKIEEVHRDAAQERQTQANRLARGPSMNNSAQRRGHNDFSPRGGGGMLSPPSAQMGGYHGPPQGRGGYGNHGNHGNQDIRFDERPSYEPRMVPMPQRSVGGEESITLGPQGGLGQGMSIRRPANTLQSDATHAGDSRRPPGGLNGFGSQRPASPVTHGGRSSPQERGAATGYVHREFASPSRPSDPSPEVSSARQQVPQGQSSSTVNSPRENALSEERLRDMSMSAIKEYYSARDEKEIGLCMKDINSPAFHPTMISLWVTDSFERKDKERDLLANLLVNLVKSTDNALTQVQLVQGFESVLTTLEDAVNDAPKAAEFLGRIFGKSVTEKVVTLTEIARLIREGGEEPGSLIEYGLGGDVLGSVLEMIKTESGEEALVEIRRSSGLRIEDFKPPAPNRSKILEKFTST